jgi:hypothetical protein
MIELAAFFICVYFISQALYTLWPLVLAGCVIAVLLVVGYIGGALLGIAAADPDRNVPAVELAMKARPPIIHKR